jgi:hypothetical protein
MLEMVIRVLIVIYKINGNRREFSFLEKKFMIKPLNAL